MPTNGFSIKPLKVKVLAGEQKATEFCLHREKRYHHFDCCWGLSKSEAGARGGVPLTYRSGVTLIVVKGKGLSLNKAPPQKKKKKVYSWFPLKKTDTPNMVHLRRGVATRMQLSSWLLLPPCKQFFTFGGSLVETPT